MQYQRLSFNKLDSHCRIIFTPKIVNAVHLIAKTFSESENL